MYPSNQQQVWGNQQYPHIATAAIGNQNPTSSQELWGGNVRRVVGILQIIFGKIELIMGIAVIFVPNHWLFGLDYVGYGIWAGVFAIVTGFLGVFSLRTKCMVIAYMVTSIINAVMSAGCFVYALSGALFSRYFSIARAANLTLYSILCIAFLTQTVISIVGASFTCNAVCPTTGQPQQVVPYSPQPMPQQCVPPPRYTVNTSQSGLTFHNTTPTAPGAHQFAKM